MTLPPSLHSNVLVATPWPPARSLSYAFSSADDIVGVDRICGGGAHMAVGWCFDVFCAVLAQSGITFSVKGVDCRCFQVCTWFFLAR